MKPKRIVAIVISVSLIAALLWRVDAQALLANLRATRWGLFAGALLLFVPQIAVIALRWKCLIAPFTPLSLGESVRLVLAGASMNLILPGKLGDLTKGWFLARQGHVSARLGLGVVVFEKMLDVAALAVFMLGGVAMLLAQMLWGAGGQTLAPSALSFASLAIAGGLGMAAVLGVAMLYFVPMEKLPGISRIVGDGEQAGSEGMESRGFGGKIQRLVIGAHSTMAVLRSRDGCRDEGSRAGMPVPPSRAGVPTPPLRAGAVPSSRTGVSALPAGVPTLLSRRGEVVALSFVIWILHLAQIYLFFASVNALPSPAEFFCMVPLAIFIGLIPVSIAGFGTRDAALVTLLQGIAPSAVLAASFYVNLRYILPAIAGLPFLARYTFLRSDQKK